MKLFINNDMIYDGELVLVNRNYPLKSEPLKSGMKNIDFENGIYIKSKMVFMLKELLFDIGVKDEFVYVSGFRTLTEQENIYESSIKENGVNFTNKYVAYPMCSEHQTGLAIDIGKRCEDVDFIRPDFPNSGIFKIFKQRAVKYGFIERYKKNKEKITGISYEPWHFRYVGYPHSLIMEKENLCLEEYIEYVKSFKHKEKSLFYIDINNLIEIFYVPFEKDGYIDIPDNISYTISGNNIDGFIVTLWRS